MIDLTTTQRTRPTKRDRAVGIATLVVGVAIIAFLTYFNSRSWINDTYLVINVSLLLFLPLVIILCFFREPVDRFGMCRATGNSPLFAAACFAVMLPVMIVASYRPEFRATYPLRPEAAYSWSYLATWELSYGLYMFSWEFFYRGFLTLGVARVIGAWPSIILQTVGFGIMHYGKPMPEFYGSFIAGMALGWLGWRGKSFLPCFAVHYAVSVTFDLLAIWHKHTLFA